MENEAGDIIEKMAKKPSVNVVQEYSYYFFISVTDTYLSGIYDAAFLEAERILCRSTEAVRRIIHKPSHGGKVNLNGKIAISSSDRYSPNFSI